MSVPYWSSSTTSPRRSLLMKAPATRPHWLSLALRRSVTYGSWKVLTVEPACRAHSGQSNPVIGSTIQ
jgi:hypothetical protein